jgi:hypothetical protein
MPVAPMGATLYHGRILETNTCAIGPTTVESQEERPALGDPPNLALDFHRHLCRWANRLEADPTAAQ